MIDVKKIIESISKKTIDDNMDLIDSCVLDSLGMIQFLSKLEDLGIEIPITRVDRNIFRKVSDIQNYLNSIEEKGL